MIGNTVTTSFRRCGRIPWLQARQWGTQTSLIPHLLFVPKSESTGEHSGMALQPSFTLCLDGAQYPAPDQAADGADQIPVRCEFEAAGQIRAEHPCLGDQPGGAVWLAAGRKPQGELGDAWRRKVQIRLTVRHGHQTKVRPPEPADKAVEQRVVVLAVERHESVQAKGRRAGALLAAKKMPKAHRHFPQADQVAKGRIRFRSIVGRRLDDGVRVGGNVASVLFTEVIGRQIVV